MKVVASSVWEAAERTTGDRLVPQQSPPDSRNVCAFVPP